MEMTTDSLKNISSKDSFREKPDGETEPAAEVGWYLQRERETLGHSLFDVATELRVDPRFLHALEQGDLHHQLGWTYVLSYVRSYSDFLGFEPGPIIRHYKNILAEETGNNALANSQENWPFTEVRAKAAIATFAGVVGLMGVAGLVFNVEKATAENGAGAEPVSKASEIFVPRESNTQLKQPVEENNSEKSLSKLGHNLPDMEAITRLLVKSPDKDDLPEVAIRETALPESGNAGKKASRSQNRFSELSSTHFASISEN